MTPQQKFIGFQSSDSNATEVFPASSVAMVRPIGASSSEIALNPTLSGHAGPGVKIMTNEPTYSIAQRLVEAGTSLAALPNDGSFPARSPATEISTAGGNVYINPAAITRATFPTDLAGGKPKTFIAVNDGADGMVVRSPINATQFATALNTAGVTTHLPPSMSLSQLAAVPHPHADSTVAKFGTPANRAGSGTPGLK